MWFSRRNLSHMKVNTQNLNHQDLTWNWIITLSAHQTLSTHLLVYQTDTIGNHQYLENIRQRRHNIAVPQIMSHHKVYLHVFSFPHPCRIKTCHIHTWKEICHQSTMTRQWRGLKSSLLDWGVCLFFTTNCLTAWSSLVFSYFSLTQ